MSDRASHSKAPADHRRKWDTLEFEKSAKAREDVEKAIKTAQVTKQEEEDQKAQTFQKKTRQQ